MKLSRKYINFGLASLALLTLSCGKGDPNSPGVEYMPDMYRSPSVEVYVDYENPNTISVKEPVNGTIVFTEDEENEMFNYPYPYANTFEDYERAGLEVKSPIAMTEETVAQGKVIFEQFCLHCHGKTGQGDGPVPTNSEYPPPPAYNGASLVNLPEGKMFHTLTYGKNMMGSHASQLNKKDRWTVIQYVKYLQNGGKMTADVADATSAEKINN
jgi:mono/diheme cytochrome c family protein